MGMMKEVSIDCVMLCIVYAVYRVGEVGKVLFGEIVGIYEGSGCGVVDREKLLDFYNKVFLTVLFPTQIIQKLQININSRRNNPEYHNPSSKPHKQN